MGGVFKINRTLPYNLKTHSEFSSTVSKAVRYETVFIFGSKSLGFSSRIDRRMFLFGSFLNLKSGNRNQIVHVGYAKLVCYMLFFCKYAHIYTYAQSLDISNNNSDYFSLTRHFIHTDDFVLVSLWYLYKTINFY